MERRPQCVSCRDERMVFVFVLQRTAVGRVVSIVDEMIKSKGALFQHTRVVAASIIRDRRHSRVPFELDQALGDQDHTLVAAKYCHDPFRISTPGRADRPAAGWAG